MNTSLDDCIGTNRQSANTQTRCRVQIDAFILLIAEIGRSG